MDKTKLIYIALGIILLVLSQCSANVEIEIHFIPSTSTNPILETIKNTQP